MANNKKDFDLEIVIDAFTKCQLDSGKLLLSEYVRGYRELARFFRLVGTVFSFVAAELNGKLCILERHMESEYCENYVTIDEMLQYEVENNLTLKKKPVVNGSRTLLRLHRALDFIFQFMAEIRHSPDDANVSQIVSKVYYETLAKYHYWFIQKMADVAILTLPKRKALVSSLCKQEPDRVWELVDEGVAVGRPLYAKTQALYERYGLLDLP